MREIIKSESPFEDCIVYKNDYGYKNKGYVEIFENNKLIYYIPYARYLGCIKENRILNKFEKVWLIDNNKPITINNIIIKKFEVFNGIGPFKGCVISKPNDGQSLYDMSVRIYNKDETCKRMHYIKYLGCIKENRILDENEYVTVINKYNQLLPENIIINKVKTIDGEGIFINCRVQLFISPTNNRMIAGVTYKTGKYKQLFYSRYLMCIKENRMLTSLEQVDHIDGDKTNDDINNLQILTPTDNKIKSIYNNESPFSKRNMINLICPHCGNIYKRKLSYYKNAIKSGLHIMYCSKNCSTSMRNYKKEKQNNLLKQYYINGGPAVINTYVINAIISNSIDFMFSAYTCEATPYSKYDEYNYVIFSDLGSTPYIK